jgi:hypothetical protein
MEKTFTIVGVSTVGKITKFRVANGDMAARVKVLERCGHTNIHLEQMSQGMTKLDAIADYKSRHPEAADVRLPNEKTASANVVKSKTVKLNTGAGRNITDAANELLKAVEEA